MELRLFGFKITIKKSMIIVLVPLLVLGVAVIGFSISKGDGIIIESKNVPAAAAGTTKPVNPVELTVDSSGTTKSKPEEEIQIYITGCVKNPGIVALKKGQLIDDAIKAAGGITEDADISNINLVYKLKDNVMLKVKSIKEPQKSSAPKPDVSSTDQSGSEAGSGVDIQKTDGGVVVNNAAAAGKSSGKVNINTATAEQLDTLPGVGSSTANDIIAYREKNGGYKNINEIMKVPGIKESRFNKIKGLITVD